MFPIGLGAHLIAQRDTLSEDSPFATRLLRDSNGLPRLEMRVYNGTGGALVAKQWYQINFDGDEESNPRLAAIASGTTNTQYVCVATEAAADAKWTWVVVWGYYTAFVEGTTDVAKDDYLKFDTSVETEAPIKDGTSRTANSVAIAREAQATAGITTDCDVFILGERITVGA